MFKREKDVIFNSLGLTIIDEQHRFGVHQRFSMLEKGGTKNQSPHQLKLLNVWRS